MDTKKEYISPALLATKGFVAELYAPIEEDCCTAIIPLEAYLNNAKVRQLVEERNKKTLDK